MGATALATVTALLSAVSLALAAPIEVGTHRQLLFDDQNLQRRHGLTRTMHQPVKYAGNPIVVKEKPWEGSGPFLYGTVMRDEAEGIFKMWYHVYVGGRPDYFTCYATSTDGIHWDRPAFNVVEDPRLAEPNNVVILGSGLPNYRQPHSPSVMFTPWDPDLAKRYKMLYWDINAGAPMQFAGACAAFSPDGIHWTNYENNPVFDIPSDVNCACWDPLGQRFVLYHKMWHVEGDVVRVEGVDFPVGRVSYWNGFNGPSEVDGKWRVWDGRVADYSTGEPRYGMATVDYAQQPTFYRAVARADSKDLIHWGNIKIIFDLPMEGDPPGTSTFGMSGFPYEGMYVGLLRVMHDELTIDLQLVYSYDDMDWRRCHDRTPFVPLGPEGSYDSGMVFCSTLPVPVGDELWFYYGASNHDHAHEGAECIALATLRRDGFVSLDADDLGEIVTKPLIFQGDRLVLNLDCDEAGYAVVELQDEAGKPIAGFTRREADRLTGDSVTRIVTWRGRSDVSRLAGQPVKARIVLRKARLYAYGFEGAEAEH
jgi:hypothetical protein